MTLAVAVAAAATLGFLAGLLTFKARQRWCPVCGASLECPVHQAAVPADQVDP